MVLLVLKGGHEVVLVLKALERREVVDDRRIDLDCETLGNEGDLQGRNITLGRAHGLAESKEGRRTIRQHDLANEGLEIDVVFGKAPHIALVTIAERAV